MYVKANGAVDYVVVSGREIVRISKERQAQLTEIIMVKIKVIFEHLRITQAKDWTSEKVGTVKQATLSAAKGVTQRAHGATARIAGEQRAAVVFTRFPALLTGGSVEVKAPLKATGKETASGSVLLAAGRPIAR